MPVDRILILGGTRDARDAAAALTTRGYAVVTSLAGVTEQPLLPAGELRVGGFGGVDGMSKYLVADAISVVVDATHPFAARISQHAHEACLRTGLPLLRLERPAWQPAPEDAWSIVSSSEKAAMALPSGARVLLTTGRKDLAHFFNRADLSGIARMIEAPPLDPPPNWRVLRDRPPFSVAGEATLLAANGITHLVSKNAGGSATEAKLTAARNAGVRVILVARPPKPQVPAVAAVSDLVAAVEGVLSP
jgi:precorrin-6A/cobalt-precorrin-6A reductase